MFDSEDIPCDSFLQVDTEDNFDVCYNCDWHRLDHKVESRDDE